ncbi:MAG: hypothetical protein KKG09_06830 [Verrucomicrobia bacterium]|nr:hypothetical protein [Verrucomicrobiota bacterium]MBU4247202.1 hypothetical protein [Verrucomicrobiota bacterium]MBU4291373.1 hypothetical protein [Verrucomicrobiota bacterium]MBU4497697.1 hypothetical protein [Verrucomicrobiota bacterium]MCG2680663.1 hypothetical protein [Kiritimatiellia bacterium]
MDILAHALYSATLFSRTGLAGGARGPIDAAGRTRSFDWTIWAAFGFGLLPDALSIGIAILTAAVKGHLFTFTGIPAFTFELYHWSHSLVAAGAVSILIRCLWKPLFLSSLAWPLHILMDMLTHGSGRFQTLLLFPISDVTLNGINWWQHPSVVLLYWCLLPVLWFGIHRCRRRTHQPNPHHDTARGPGHAG